MGIRKRSEKRRRYSSQRCTCGGKVPLNTDLNNPIDKWEIQGKCILCGLKWEFIQ